jgi:hypothetical protein
MRKEFMKMDSERRSGIDRRKLTGLNMLTFVGNGARITIRRQGDKGHIFFVDQYSTVLFLTIVGILFLCVIDALLTLFLLNHGAYEKTPLWLICLRSALLNSLLPNTY